MFGAFLISLSPAQSSSCSTNQMGLFGSAIVCGQVLAERTEAVDTQLGELPAVGKITKSGIKYFDYRVGEGVTPRFVLLSTVMSLANTTRRRPVSKRI